MSQRLIRNLDDAVTKALRRRAASGISKEEPLHRTVADAMELDGKAAARRLTALRRCIGPAAGPSVIDDLRRNRDRDSG